MLSALIFDFDGVIADSEALANTVLAEFITDLGHATNLDDSLEHYSGRRWDDAMAAIQSVVARARPDVLCLQELRGQTRISVPGMTAHVARSVFGQPVAVVVK